VTPQGCTPGVAASTPEGEDYWLLNLEAPCSRRQADPLRLHPFGRHVLFATQESASSDADSGQLRGGRARRHHRVITPSPSLHPPPSRACPSTLSWAWLEREFFFDNLLVRIHFIVVMVVEQVGGGAPLQHGGRAHEPRYRHGNPTPCYPAPWSG